MRSPYNPLADDIREWAYDGSAMEPVQDWDLILSTVPYESLFMKLAADNECPKHDYFLALLYLIVGDAVRTKYRTRSHDDVEQLLGKAEKEFQSHWLRLWVQRARELLAKPDAFSYDAWCGGELARDNGR